MGLIKAALGSAGGVLADQWKDYFYCESLPADVLVEKGQKRNSGRSSSDFCSFKERSRLCTVRSMA